MRSTPEGALTWLRECLKEGFSIQAIDPEIKTLQTGDKANWLADNLRITPANFNITKLRTKLRNYKRHIKAMDRAHRLLVLEHAALKQENLKLTIKLGTLRIIHSDSPFKTFSQPRNITDTCPYCGVNGPHYCTIKPHVTQGRLFDASPYENERPKDLADGGRRTQDLDNGDSNKE